MWSVDLLLVAKGTSVFDSIKLATYSTAVGVLCQLTDTFSRTQVSDCVRVQSGVASPSRSGFDLKIIAGDGLIPVKLRGWVQDCKTGPLGDSDLICTSDLISIFLDWLDLIA